MHATIRFLVETLPLGIFFVSYKLYDIMTATMYMVVATTIALIISTIYEKKVPVMPLVSTSILLIFAGLTFFSGNSEFIKMKPTVVNLMFAAILFAGIFFNKPVLKYVIGKALNLSDMAWKKLSCRWAFFFVILAVVNEIVWRNFSEQYWVNFKVFAIIPLTIIFTLLQVPFIQKHSITQR
jgi:intracellular septation protein